MPRSGRTLPPKRRRPLRRDFWTPSRRNLLPCWTHGFGPVSRRFCEIPTRAQRSHPTGAKRRLSAGGVFHPRKSSAQALERSRPLSRVLSWAVIPLGCASPRTSSDLPGSLGVGHTLRPRAPHASLFGLASGGVCRAVDVATPAVRSYRTISPLPAPLARHVGGIFLLHFP